jgi:hypothetical protein
MQVVGKENVARKVTVLLNTISRHCKNISGAGAQIATATQPPIAAVLKRRHAILQRVLLAILALSLSFSLSLYLALSLARALSLSLSLSL